MKLARRWVDTRIGLALVVSSLLVSAGISEAATLQFSGLTVTSQATGVQEPWYLSITYRYLDGLNHAPRVPEQYYTGLWSPGGHAGIGTSSSGWNSLNNEQPGWYAFDYEGCALDREVLHDTIGDPMYGYEERWYKGGTWRLLNLNNSTQEASGTMGTMYMVINYAPPSGQGAGGSATVTIAAANDGGAVYNELMSRWGSPYLTVTLSCNQPPVLVVGGSTSDPATWWAEFLITTTLTTPAGVECQYDLVGDLNNDCRVDFVDFAMMANNWLVDCIINPVTPPCIARTP
jgi:hypothetical protein